ncbi:MAG: trigger factor [Actinomycetota bacterium]
MNTTVSREGPTRVLLTVDVPPEEIRPAVDRAFRRLASQVKIPGFRPGKAPRAVLEARLGGDEIKDMIIREALPQFYAQAVVGEDLEPVSEPQIDVKSFEEQGGLSFEAVVEVKPEIELPPLGDISAQRRAWRATPQDVEEQLARLQDRFATLEPVTRPLRKGDFALIDVKGYWNDQEIENATATDMLYEVGSGRVVGELDGELDAKRTGDILKFNAVLPPEYGSTWGDREVSFQVLVKDVRQKNAPALDDDFAKTASEFETLDELKQDLSSRIGTIKRAAADADVRGRVLERLVESVQVVVPDAMIEEEMSWRLRRFSDQLNEAGVSLDDYLAGAETTEEQVESDVRRQAERSVTAQLILEEIARREELKVSDEELDREMAKLAEGAGRTPGEVRKQLETAGRVNAVAGDIIRRKALDLVVDKADITDEDAATQ